ncbi:integrase core domain-containing protein [Spartinivicinus poritis]|uniref:integrase core domain-containing protein n=1 Tax=Spartinivicinus poritis TaxID=2994640 RepID=UPI003CC90DEB
MLGSPPTERVFRKLNSEWLHRIRFQTKHEARQAIWDYITYYNSERKHSALNY